MCDAGYLVFLDGGVACVISASRFSNPCGVVLCGWRRRSCGSRSWSGAGGER